MSKICPKCNKEWPDDFMACPMDQTPLVTKPQQPAGFSLNLGDANAISGGVNLSDNHSINTTSNVDSHNVITNNITQVEREKTPEELKHEKELAFREACLEAYSTGILTSENKRKLDDMQYRLGLDGSSASRILSEVSKRIERKSSSLSPVHQITFNNIKTAINNNRLDLVNRLMAQMKAMVQRYSVEEIQFTYYMLQAILHPQKCIEEYEKQPEDKYWQTFWSSIAYRRAGNVTQSELLVSDVQDKWIETFPQENVFILATVNYVIDNDIDYARYLYDNIKGEHSLFLFNLASCLCTLFDSDMLSSEQLKQMQKDGAFYMDNLFSGVIDKMSEGKHSSKEVEINHVDEDKLIKKEPQLNTEKDTELQNEEKANAKADDKPQSKYEEPHPQQNTSCIFDENILSKHKNKFGYLKMLSASEISELKQMLLSAPKDNYQAQFALGQLYLQEKQSAANQRLAYNTIKSASEHGVYEAGAYMAYFYLYGKVVKQDLDEAERRIKIDEDYKKNPIFIQMMIDLYAQKGNDMLADVWKTKLSKYK